MVKNVKNKGLVSVIVPVYNLEDYLEKCLHSLTDQTYPYLEVYLVDDGSTDRTGQICDRYAAQDSRFRVIHQNNKGLSGARNTALDLISGDFLLFVDGDDWIDTDLIEDLINEIDGYDLIAFGVTSVSGENLYRTPRTRMVLDKISAVKELDNGTALSGNVWNKLYRTHLWDDVRFPEGRKCEDLFVTPRVLYNCDRILVSERFGYYYLWYRPGSICSVRGPQFFRDGTENQLCNALYFEEKGEPELAAMFWEMGLKFWVYYYCDTLENKDREAHKDCKKFYRELKTKYAGRIDGTKKLKAFNLAITLCPRGVALLRQIKHKRVNRISRRRPGKRAQAHGGS